MHVISQSLVLKFVLGAILLLLPLGNLPGQDAKPAVEDDYYPLLTLPIPAISICPPS